MKTNNALFSTQRPEDAKSQSGDNFRLRREAKCHATFVRATTAAAPKSSTRSKAVSPLCSATAVQIFASLLRLTRHGAATAVCVLALIPSIAGAATNDLSGLLQRGLFEEEANRNLDAAAQAYQTVSAQFDKDRKLAATAIFRLGEIYRKQSKTNEAVGQYERIVREFADQDTLVTLSRQNLAGLGINRPGVDATEPPPTTAVASPEAQELARLERILLQLTGRDVSQLRRLIPVMVPDADFERLEEQLKLLENYGASAPKEIVQKGEEMKKLLIKRTEELLNTLIRQAEELRKTVAKQKSVGKSASPIAEGKPPRLVTTVLDEEEAEIRRIQAMIQNSPDLINAAGGNDSMTPLSRAASRGQLRVGAFLLDHGANINLDNPLYKASAGGHKAMVEFLLRRRAEVNVVGWNGQTALHQAVDRGFISVTETLLAAKADPNVRDGLGSQTPLTMAAKHGFLPGAAALLMHGADPNVVSTVQPGDGTNAVKEGRTMFGAPLHFAAARGDAAMTSLLLSNRADVKALSIYNETPLDVAAALGKAKAAELLLAAGADPNARRFDDAATPLVQAVWSGNREVVKLLLEYGANPNVTVLAGQAGVTPLMSAASQKDPELVALLLKYKADPKPSDAKGNTALLNAVLSRSPETVRALLAAGADPDTKNSSGSPVLRISVTDAMSREVAAALLEAKANVNAPDSNGLTPLHWAGAYSRRDLAELLVKAGADTNRRDNHGSTPLDLVKAAKRPDSETFAAWLRQQGALDDLPDFNAIRITRKGLAQTYPIFSKVPKMTNQFTLLETVMRFYTFRASYIGREEGGGPINLLPYPDFGRVIIRRPRRTVGGKQQEIKVSLLNSSNAVDCAKDVPVEFGDIIEIPERVHALNESLDDPAREMEWGLIKTTAGTIAPRRWRDRNTFPTTREDREAHGRANTNANWSCLLPAVKLVVAGEQTLLVVDSWKEGFLSEALSKTEARAVLRSSSDLSRVKVTRKNTSSGNPEVLIVDVSNNAQRNDDLWLRDGDVIEVPDKQ
ncbi:MAG: hypothetical protein HOP33_03340 [Verrucomicrobia bacterium]|nr:hypothetical protein [Verrucomicrobiota bacterium]